LLALRLVFATKYACFTWCWLNPRSRPIRGM
jgi:hypothetical protein